MRKLLQFPANEPAQAIRARHMLMAAASYLTIIVFVLYCSHIGLFRMSPVHTLGFVGLAAGINVLFYAAICSGWNKRLRDPSMTLPQIIVSAIWLMFVLYFIDGVRGSVLTLFLIIFIFGTLRLRAGQFLGAALFSLAGYAAVIALLVAHRPQSINLRIEVLQWVLLAMVLPWFAVIGAYISSIRRALRQKNKEMAQALQTIERLASHDELTGICNRRFLIEVLRREKTRCDRSHHTFCLAMLDLDSFKAINDRYGHLGGDDVLREFARCVQDELRQSDYFARYGGEEFALLLVDTDLEWAGSILERIRQRVASHAFPHLGCSVTVSAGVTQYRNGEGLDELIARADRALYAAKDDGRNLIRLSAA